MRELKNNPNWDYAPVGFVDDDILKKDKVIHGLRVFGGNGSLHQICTDNNVQEILVSFRKIDAQRLKQIKTICKDMEISLKRAALKIEPLDFD